jgi:hypothetical protein
VEGHATIQKLAQNIQHKQVRLFPSNVLYIVLIDISIGKMTNDQKFYGLLYQNAHMWSTALCLVPTHDNVAPDPEVGIIIVV